MNETVRAELLALEAEDKRVRAELAADGSLFDGYHPRMEAVHHHNGAVLLELIAQHGWPGVSLAGEDGANAAWLIAQHAIGEPELQRECLRLIQAAVSAGDAPAWQAAYLEDRIRTFEGRPQRYGTQMDIGPDGHVFPLPLEDPERVEDLRRSVGLEPIAPILERRPNEPIIDAETRARREQQYQQWLREVGWRS